jgi:hypothetical protein
MTLAADPLEHGGIRPGRKPDREPDREPGRTPGRIPDRTPGRAAGAERRAGRRSVSVTLLLIGVFALVSGTWSLLLGRGSLVIPIHAAAGCLFGLLSGVHVRYNRNTLRTYLRDVGWSPAVLRLTFASAISLALLPIVLRFI